MTTQNAMQGMTCQGCSWDHASRRKPSPKWCHRPAKVTHEGKHYCGIHDPVAQKERQEKRSAAAQRRRKWRDEQRAAQRNRLAAIRAPLNADDFGPRAEDYPV